MKSKILGKNPGKSGQVQNKSVKHKSFKSKALTRKEQRKELRKNKKLQRHQFAQRRSKKVVEGTAEDSVEETVGKSSKNVKTKGQKKTAILAENKPKKVSNDLRKHEAKLKKEMEETRRKRLMEDNDEEDRTIRQLEKKLKLNKKAIIPASFRTDGLDYLLEICTSSKSKKTTKDSKAGEDDADSEDVPAGEHVQSDAQDAEFDDDQLDSDLGEDDDVEDEGTFSDDDLDVDDADLNENDLNESEDFGSDEDAGGDSDDDAQKKEKDGEEYWEDIYGRLRTKDGAVVDAKVEEKKPEQSSTTKYVPPALRKNQSTGEKIRKSLKGLLNRLAETNMHSISQQVEQMYMSNSRNEMNEAMLDLYFSSLALPTLMSERIILEHSMLVAILHANIGSEIGAYVLQNVVQKFKSLYDQTDSLEESKELCNICLLLGGLYHFKIVDCSLIFEILNFMGKSFTAKDVELILVMLKMIGFRLRKDDPVQLKNFIIFVQQQASNKPSELSDSRVKFMLDILLAIRNNNVNKIPNYDPSFGEHLSKMLKQHVHKGNYVTELKIGMQDLLDAESKGRWWIVGSAWSNDSKKDENADQVSTPLISEQTKLNAKLLKKAKKFGMNTDVRRNVFCVLMSAEDYLDAFEKLMHLGLKNQLERELVHVTVYCCLHENKYNPYYSLVLSKLCSEDRKYMLTLQYNLWDRLKDMESLLPQQLHNMSILLADLINRKSLSVTVLKVIEFGDMNKEKLVFLRSTLSSILLYGGKEHLEDVFGKIAMAEKLYMFRESLRLFMGHFLRSEELVIDGETIENSLDKKSLGILEGRIKLAERAMNFGHGRVQL